jgi:peptidoglycan/LPS O-acetylase OafA/YrhL
MKEIKALTALRGIFAIWVVFFHLLPDSPKFPVLIINKGYLGVDFFFMLSGFILAGAHGAQFEGGHCLKAYRQFVAKRFVRLFPLHLFILAFVCLTIYLEKGSQYWAGYILDEASLVHRWGFIHAPRVALNGPDWSISTEWAANLLFPIFILLTGFSAKSYIRSILTIVLSILTIIWLAHSHGDMNIAEANSYLPIIRCFSEFALGICLYARQNWFTPISSDLVLIAAFMIAVVGLIFRADFVVILVLIPTLPALAQNMGWMSRFLSAKPFHYLGVISYSIYLVQRPIMQSIDFASSGLNLASTIHWIVTPVIIILAASLTYPLIEKNSIEFFRPARRKSITLE